jgi:hypothetical protein
MDPRIETTDRCEACGSSAVSTEQCVSPFKWETLYWCPLCHDVPFDVKVYSRKDWLKRNLKIRQMRHDGLLADRPDYFSWAPDED